MWQRHVEDKGKGQTALTSASAGGEGVSGGRAGGWGGGAEIDPRCSAHARIGEESALGEVTPSSEAVRVPPPSPQPRPGTPSAFIRD